MNKYVFDNLFGIPGLHIAWYGVIIGIGIALGLGLAISLAKRQHFKSDLIIDFVMIVIPVAIICARLYYVIFEWNQYAGNWVKIFAINEGGLAIYGAVIGGILTAYIFSKLNRFPLLILLDLLIPSLVLGQAIGRWGNFVNEEAFGNLISNPKLQFFPFGVYITRLSEWHQATFFYESTWNICLLAVLLLMQRKVYYPGAKVATYFIGYGLGRFLIEGLRTDSLYVLPGVRVSQIVSLVLIFIGIGMVVILKTRVINNAEYSGKYQFTSDDNG